MTARTRTALKALFEDGDQPDQDDFGDVFDSFQLLTEDVALTDYANVIVVDADGNGDHTTLKDAVDAASAGDVIVVFGQTSETASIDIGCDLTLWITAGAEVAFASAKQLRCGTYTVTIIGPGKITGNNNTELLDVGSTATVTLQNLTVDNDDATGCAIRKATGTPTLKIFNSQIYGEGTALGYGPYSSSSLFIASYFCGSIAVHSVSSWTSAPFYHCVFQGAVTNLTADAGAANGSNIET
jgi:hypothetical protein